jgi:hypothetical protein
MPVLTLDARPWNEPFREIRPEELVYVSNSATPWALAVDTEYCNAHAIPLDHLIQLNLPLSSPTTWNPVDNGDIYDSLMAPIAAKARAIGARGVLLGATVPARTRYRGIVVTTTPVTMNGNTNGAPPTAQFVSFSKYYDSKAEWLAAQHVAYTDVTQTNFTIAFVTDTPLGVPVDPDPPNALIPYVGNLTRRWPNIVNQHVLDLATPGFAGNALDEQYQRWWDPTPDVSAAPGVEAVRGVSQSYTEAFGVADRSALAVGRVGQYQWSSGAYIEADTEARIRALNARYIAAQERSREESFAKPHLVLTNTVGDLRNQWSWLSGFLRQAGLNLAYYHYAPGGIAAACLAYAPVAGQLGGPGFNMDTDLFDYPVFALLGADKNPSPADVYNNPYFVQRWRGIPGSHGILIPSFGYAFTSMLATRHEGLASFVTPTHITTTAATYVADVFFNLLRGMSYLEAMSWGTYFLPGYAGGDPLYRPYKIRAGSGANHSFRMSREIMRGMALDGLIKGR